MKMSLPLFMLLLVGWADAQALPRHPDKLEFAERTLHFPERAGYRHELATGDVAFVVEDHSLPLVRISLTTRAGSYLLSRAQAGQATLTSTMLRDGGTGRLSPSELDERLVYLATGISFSIGSTSSQASVDTLTDNLAESLDLMFEMLLDPGMDAERLAINKDRVIEQMRRRNDDTRGIEPRVWSELLHGEEFFVTNRASQATVEAITDADLKALARRVFARGHLIIAISGDVDKQAILDDLTARLARLPEAESLPPIPDDPQPAAPGLYGVNKDDVNQSRVSMGHPGPMLGHPDEYAITIMNEILGGGGFTSRITSRVRSDEGLAYSAGSGFGLGRFYPGSFRAFFQSRNERVAEALEIVLQEIARIRSGSVSDKELSIAIEGRISFLADLYSSARRMVRRFAADELNQEDPQYWRNYEVNVRKVTAADVQRVATEHLKPEQLRFLVVGKLDEVNADDVLIKAAGHPLVRIPLKDPLTLEPLE
jgi:predicted Zn-dependent peptidase